MAAVKNPNAALDVIKLIVSGEINFDAVGKILAYTHPAVFLEMLDAIKGETVNFLPWMREAVDHLLSGNKVNSIKCIRNATGLGLKEAKDVADHLSVRLGQWNNDYSPSAFLPGESVEAYNLLVAYCKHAGITLANSSL